MIRTEGTEQLEQIGGDLREASDHALTNAVRGELRRVAKPLGESVLRRGAEEMPHRGGLSQRVASQGKVGVSTALVTKTVRVSLLLRNKGVAMKSLDEGFVRHPVFGRGRWVRQSVPAGAFSRAFKQEAAAARVAALRGAQLALDGVARKY